MTVEAQAGIVSATGSMASPGEGAIVEDSAEPRGTGGGGAARGVAPRTVVPRTEAPRTEAPGAVAPELASPSRQLDIALVRDTGGRTHIGHQFVAYPFHLCRALRTLGDPLDMPTLYIQSCSGGVFEGDDLRCRFSVGRQARVHLTSAAATIVHTMEKGDASMKVEIEAAAGAYVEYLPDPLILFPGASLRNALCIRLAQDATVLAWDSFFAHDPKGEGRVFRDLTTELRLMTDTGGLLACDRFRAEGSAFSSGAPGVMGKHRTHAGFVLARRQAPVDLWLGGLRQALPAESSAYVGLSALPNGVGVWVRALAPDAAQSNAILTTLWSRAREMITGSVPIPRRK